MVPFTMLELLLNAVESPKQAFDTVNPDTGALLMNTLSRKISEFPAESVATRLT